MWILNIMGIVLLFPLAMSYLASLIVKNVLTGLPVSSFVHQSTSFCPLQPSECLFVKQSDLALSLTLNQFLAFSFFF